MYGDDFGYADTRLRDTIVRHRNTPVWVRGVGPGMMTVIEYLLTGRRTEVPLDTLDLEPVPLGYVQVGDRYVYLTRVPKRDDWRQGLRHNTMRLVDQGPMSVKQLPNDSMARCIRNDYPNFEEAKQELNLGREVVAWCREWAISPWAVYHKGREVGERPNGEIRLFQDKNYLQESLEDAINAGI